MKTPAFEGGARFSPGARWIAYVSNESGQMQVYIRPFSGPDRRWQVSTEGGTSPVWNRNDRELFYRTGNKMMSVDWFDELTRLAPARSPRLSALSLALSSLDSHHIELLVVQLEVGLDRDVLAGRLPEILQHVALLALERPRDVRIHAQE